MAEQSRAVIFAQAREAFAQRGLLRQSLRLCLGERVYSARCDDDCFSLYRINDKPFLPPGLPGWMVCRLGVRECFSLDQDEKACSLPLTREQLDHARTWLELVLKNLPGEDA